MAIQQLMPLVAHAPRCLHTIWSLTTFSLEETEAAPSSGYLEDGCLTDLTVEHHDCLAIKDCDIIPSRAGPRTTLSRVLICNIAICKFHSDKVAACWHVSAKQPLQFSRWLQA